MSLDQANAFRDYVAQNEDVQKEIRSALMTESAKVSEIAAKHGFTFTSEEGQQAWESAQDNELSDFELDMVAGGTGDWGGNGSSLLAFFACRKRSLIAARWVPITPKMKRDSKAHLAHSLANIRSGLGSQVSGNDSIANSGFTLCRFPCGS